MAASPAYGGADRLTLTIGALELDLNYAAIVTTQLP
jgi:hypothetical protein